MRNARGETTIAVAGLVMGRAWHVGVSHGQEAWYLHGTGRVAEPVGRDVALEQRHVGRQITEQHLWKAGG